MRMEEKENQIDIRTKSNVEVYELQIFKPLGICKDGFLLLNYF